MQQATRSIATPLNGMLVHRRITPLTFSLVPIYTPGQRDTMWGKVSCPRPQVKWIQRNSTIKP